MQEMFYFSFKAQGFFFCFNSHDTFPKIVNVNEGYVGAYDFFSRLVGFINKKDIRHVRRKAKGKRLKKTAYLTRPLLVLCL